MIVLDYIELKSLDPSAHKGVIVADEYRGGLFLPRLVANLPVEASAKMSIDTQEGMYVASSFAPDWVWVRKYDGIPNVWQFGAVPISTFDSGPAIQCAINVTGWGKLELPVGNHKSQQTLYAPPGFTFIGHGVQHTPDMGNQKLRGSVLIGSHSGAAVLSLKGAYNSSLQDICLWGDQANPPKTILSLGRASGGSAGRHHISNVNAVGFATKAAIYSIASEENNFVSLRANVLGGGAKHTLFTSEHDELAVDGMVSSSNFTSYISGFNLLHQGSTADSTVFWQSMDTQSQTWVLRDGFMGMTAGANSSFVRLHLNNSPLGDFSFENIGFEATNSAAPPLETFKITGAGTLKGLRIVNCSEGMFQSGTQKFINNSGAVTLHKPVISCAKLAHPSVLGSVVGGSVTLPGTASAYYGPIQEGGASGLRDLTVVTPCPYTGTTPLVYFVEIQANNTFRWIGNATGNVPYNAENVPITGGEQTLSNGVRIKFGQITGHTVGTFWYWSAYP